MLPRKARVPVGEVLRTHPRVFYGSPALTLKAKVNELGHNRYGVVVSAAAEPKSTRRHLLKRQILGVVRAWPPFSLDCVFVLGRSASQLSSSDLRAELERVLASVRSNR